MKRRNTILLVVLIMTLSVLFISCDPLKDLHELDRFIMLEEVAFATEYSMVKNDIDSTDIDYPLSLTYTLPASFNKDYKEDKFSIGFPPKFVRSGSEIKINVTYDEDESIETVTVNIKSKNIPGRKAKVVGINDKAKNESTYTLNGVEIVLPGE